MKRWYVGTVLGDEKHEPPPPIIATIINLEVSDDGQSVITVKEDFMTVKMTLNMGMWNTLAGAYGENGMDWIGQAAKFPNRHTVIVPAGPPAPFAPWRHQK